MMLAHVGGVPVEETVLQFASLGAATVSLVAITGRATLRRLLKRLRDR
jgi:hypothetical protein